MKRVVVCGLTVVLSGLAAGCGLGAGSGTRGASVLVTRDFGTTTIGAVSAPRTPGSETVMRLLERNFRVQTRYGGGFVQSIEGLAGTGAGGSRRDWFYYVNGIEASRGAADTTVHRGDRIWWDRHDWGAAMRAPAVVGSFPEPFRSGIDGQRLPARIDCAEVARPACDEVQRRLATAGVVAARTALGATTGADTLRIVVGPWAAVRTDTPARQIEHGPSVSGVYARFDASGRRLDLLDASGRRTRTLTSAGLVAAVRYSDQAPTWVVAGTDAAGALAAARSLTPGALARRFAIAVVAGGSVALPTGVRR